MKKYWPNAKTEPLRITAHLQAGVISDGTLPFDSLLYFIAHRQALGEQGMTVPGARLSDRESGAVVPLARLDAHTSRWYYAASFAQWEAPYADARDHWNKRFDSGLADLIDFSGRRGAVEIASGRYKAYHMPVFYRHSTLVRWYARGNRETIERLLPHLTNIGKKTAQGWGAVRQWEVELWSEDWSVRRAGDPMRSIPSDHGLLFGFRPAYWLRSNQHSCEMPATLPSPQAAPVGPAQDPHEQ